MVEEFAHSLPHGITLHCRAAGAPGRPMLLFLHGFPEGAFIWDELLAHFAQPENGGYRCVAPCLRGFGRSSAPTEVEAYRDGLHCTEGELAAVREGMLAQGRGTFLVKRDAGSFIARADLAVRETAEHWLVRLQQAWGEVLGDPQLAWAILAQCVGALLVARMLATPQRQEEVLNASRRLLDKQLAGGS